MSRKTIERNISYDEARGLYYVLLDYGVDKNGRRIKQYQTRPSLLTARNTLQAFQVEREQLRQVRPHTMLLAQWLDYWMEEVICPSRAATTIHGYRNIVTNHLIPAMGDIPLQKVSPQDIQRYYNMLLYDKQLSPNTVRRHHDLLSSALRMAVKQYALTQNPIQRVDPPRLIPYHAKFYNPEELRRLCVACSGTWLELVVHLAGGLGLRREEICGLRWSAVDFRARLIHIREARTSAGAVIIHKETKNTSSTRSLYLSDYINSLLHHEYNRQIKGNLYDKTGHVLLNRQGKPYPPDALTLAFSRFISRKQLPKITLHGLRHTFATLASAQGAPLFDIGKALGHSTPATTGRIYTHLLDQTHATTISRVADAMR